MNHLEIHLEIHLDFVFNDRHVSMITIWKNYAY